MPLKPRESYTFAIQDMARHFNHFLNANSDSGILMCDGRMHNQDAQVAHSIFTLKHQAIGDELPHLVETSIFGRSENHVGLQLADLVVSALLFPMAARAYCAKRMSGVHVHPNFDTLRDRYGHRLRPIQNRYMGSNGRMRGGIVVSDKPGKQPSKVLFQPSP